MKKLLIIAGIIFIIWLGIAIAGEIQRDGGLYEYPCGQHLNNGYYRSCK